MNRVINPAQRIGYVLEPKGRLNWQPQDWFLVFLLISFGICLFLPALGAMGILDPTDGYYSEGAREMVETGNYLVPQLNYVPWFEKPILIYWLIAASYKMFGVSEWAARLPSALSGMALIPLTYFLARQFLRRRAAFLASIVLLTSPLLLVVGHLALTDLPLTLCIWLSFTGLLLALKEKSKIAFWLTYPALGLAFLCKGPIGLVLPGISIVLYLVCTLPSPLSFVQWKKEIAKLNVLWGAIVTGLVALPWYVLVTKATHGAFFQEFFVRQNLGRAMGVVCHQEPIWFYVPFLLGGFLPWCALAFALPPLCRRLWAHRQLQSSRTQIAIFSLVCVSSLFVVLSVITTKLPTYILPIWPALALLAGIILDTSIRTKKTQVLFRAGCVVSIVILAALPFLPKLLAQTTNLIPYAYSALGTTLIFTVASLASFKQGKAKSGIFQFAVAFVFGLAIAVPTSLQVFENLKENDLRSLVRIAEREQIHPVVYGNFVPSTMFYLHCHIPSFDKSDKLVDYLKQQHGSQYLLVHYRWRKDMKDIPAQFQEMEHTKRWSLYRLELPADLAARSSSQPN